MEATHYYPFGLTMAGVSSKALKPNYAENKYRFNGTEQNGDFELSMYDAHYRNLDPQIGRFWQIDPKPNEMVSSYAAMLNNPIRFSDPLGDTTWVYNQNGVFCGVVNDKLKNQVHFMKTDGDPGKAFDASKLSAKDARNLGLAFRKNSVAFIGSKTASDMSAIAKKSVATGVEIAFVGVVGKDNEIRLNALPIDKENRLDFAPSECQINESYSADEQTSNLFLEGHTHIRAYNDALNSPDILKSYAKKGLPDQSPSKPDDYDPLLIRGNDGKKGPAPAMVVTPFGVTLYGTGHMTPMQQPSPNNTYLNYKILK